MTKEKKKSIIVGIGNKIMGDDGAGDYVISLLKEKYPFLELKVLNTPAYSILSFIQNKDKIIIIDAADFNGKPGDIRKIYFKELKIDKNISPLSSFSLHSSLLIPVLQYGIELNIISNNIILYCIQIKEIKPNLKLSKEVEEGCKKVFNLIKKELKL